MTWRPNPLWSWPTPRAIKVGWTEKEFDHLHFAYYPKLSPFLAACLILDLAPIDYDPASCTARLHALLEGRLDPPDSDRPAPWPWDAHDEQELLEDLHRSADLIAVSLLEADGSVDPKKLVEWAIGRGALVHTDLLAAIVQRDSSTMPVKRSEFDRLRAESRPRPARKPGSGAHHALNRAAILNVARTQLVELHSRECRKNARIADEGEPLHELVAKCKACCGWKISAARFVEQLNLISDLHKNELDGLFK